jgi:hypothetical protein
VDRTIPPATAGEDASGAVGVAVVKLRERRPEYKPELKPGLNSGPRPKADQYSLIRLRRQLLRESQLVKGSQQ